MAIYDCDHNQWVLRDGDLAYWLDGEKNPVRCRIELITDERVYLKATTDDAPMRRGQIWWESRISRRVAPREKVVYFHKGKGHFDWRQVRLESAA